MTVEWKHIGSHGGSAASLIEVKVSDWNGNASISEDVTNIQGFVEIELIHNLRQLADDLEEQNRLVNSHKEVGD